LDARLDVAHVSACPKLRVLAHDYQRGPRLDILASDLLLFALTFRALVFQPFNTPSGSMMPTLQVGDYVFVSKFPYGYSRYSFYNLIPFSGRIFPRRAQAR
jgi:Signal peptidase, peptidase S26